MPSGPPLAEASIGGVDHEVDRAAGGVAEGFNDLELSHPELDPGSEEAEKLRKQFTDVYRQSLHLPHAGKLYQGQSLRPGWSVMVPARKKDLAPTLDRRRAGTRAVQGTQRGRVGGFGRSDRRRQGRRDSRLWADRPRHRDVAPLRVVLPILARVVLSTRVPRNHRYRPVAPTRSPYRRRAGRRSSRIASTTAAAAAIGHDGGMGRRP